jgi:dienelactone hydrolase
MRAIRLISLLTLSMVAGSLPGLALAQRTSPALSFPDASREADLPNLPGSGPYPAIMETETSLPDHVVYRPSDLAKMGSRKLGVVLWGNGGCSADGASARQHLLEIASHGYVVITPGHILSGPSAKEKPAPGTPLGQLPPVATTSADMRNGLDWALARNADKAGRYAGRIDPAMTAASGHSCGGLQALELAPDPRIHALIINNSGVFADGSNPIQGISVNKAMLKRIHTPVIYILGGPTDIAYPNGTDDFTKIDHVPAALVNIPVGHGGTFGRPYGGAVAQVVVDWLEWQLRGDETAGRSFTGPACRLCVAPGYTIERKKID